jgi:hypothetical protein
MRTSGEAFARQVFINCPFDEEYLPLLRAMTFAIHACGYRALCALEVIDAGEVRMSRILRLIKSSRFGIHDVSRTTLDPLNHLPRFNMPLEMGLFLGAAHFGDGPQRTKRTLVFDVERYRYQKFISDIAGQDIKAHGNDPAKVITSVRDWLNSSRTHGHLPGGRAILRLYERFLTDVPPMLDRLKLHDAEISFADWLRIVQRWLEQPER